MKLNGDHPKIQWVPKGWGGEEIIVNKPEYCGKKLTFMKGKQCSLHYHENKDETFFVLSGKVQMLYHEDGPFLMKAKNEGRSEKTILNMCEKVILESGDTFYVPQNRAHRVIALEETKVIEFSTEHFDEDSIRIFKGN